VKTINNDSFGVLIAYVVPGCTALVGIGFLSETVERWLGAVPSTVPTISGFLYGTLASVGLGVLANTVRGLVIDPIHHATGIEKHEWDYAVLQQNLAAVEFIVLNQFRFHQFHGNTMVALAVAYAAFESSTQGFSLLSLVGFLTVEVVLLLGSRRALRLYYCRLQDVLGLVPESSVAVTAATDVGKTAMDPPNPAT